VWRDLEAALMTVRPMLKYMGVDTRSPARVARANQGEDMKTYEQLAGENEAWKQRQQTKGEGMNNETEQEVFERVMAPLISGASDEALAKMVTGPDKDGRPEHCMSRKTARLAGIELAMRLTGERKRVVHVPVAVRNARHLVGLLRGAGEEAAGWRGLGCRKRGKAEDGGRRAEVGSRVPTTKGTKDTKEEVRRAS
jgi:hypothetical protein